MDLFWQNLCVLVDIILSGKDIVVSQFYGDFEEESQK